MDKSFNLKKSLGQNFLIDKNVIKKIIDLSEIENDALVIEIGPGNGALTKELVKKNINVLAFEIDKSLSLYLDEIKSLNLKIVYEDFLKVNLKEYIKEYNYSKLYVISNLPYYITTPIITKIIEEIEVDTMVLMVQKEVGDRFKAKPNTKQYNSLSIYLQLHFNIEKLFIVSSNSFIPKPNVDSIVLKFTKNTKDYDIKDKEVFYKLVKDAFTFKRKNLKNNLKNYDLVKIEKVLRSFNKDLTSRAESLSIDEFVEISNELVK